MDTTSSIDSQSPPRKDEAPTPVSKFAPGYTHIAGGSPAYSLYSNPDDGYSMNPFETPRAMGAMGAFGWGPSMSLSPVTVGPVPAAKKKFSRVFATNEMEPAVEDWTANATCYLKIGSLDVLSSAAFFRIFQVRADIALGMQATHTFTGARRSL